MDALQTTTRTRPSQRDARGVAEDSARPVPGKYKKRKKDTLGRLKTLGPQEPWQVALLLPRDWDDLRACCNQFDFAPPPEGLRVVVRGTLHELPTVSFDRGPRATGYIHDASGRKLGYTVFGDSREFVAALRDGGADVVLYGTVKAFSESKLWLTQPEVVTHSPWRGRLRPVYPGKTRVIAPATVRERVTQHLRAAIPEAALRLHRQLSDETRASATSAPGDQPREIPAVEHITHWLWHAHWPTRIEDGRQAQTALEKLAAQYALAGLEAQARVRTAATFQTPADPEIRKAALPYALTTDQSQALTDILDDIRGGGPTGVRAHAKESDRVSPPPPSLPPCGDC